MGKQIDKLLKLAELHINANQWSEIMKLAKSPQEVHSVAQSRYMTAVSGQIG